MIEVLTETEVEAVEVCGCQHTVYLSADHVRERRRDHQTFYCTVCGNANSYPGKSKEEYLRGQLNST